MADVFVSYDRRDRELAEKVVQTLTKQGLTVWWDDRITPHETWDKTIEREVDSARRVLVLWTNHSVQSDWVRTEAGAAKESTPPKLIQARFSDCKVPLAFRLLQHVDLIGWTPTKKHAGWDRLIGWLKDGIQTGAETPAAAAPEAPAPVVTAPEATVRPAAPEPVAPTQPEPAAAPAPLGFANLAAATAPEGSTKTGAETPSASSSAGGEGVGGAAAGASTRSQGPDGKKLLIIGAAIFGGLTLIAIIVGLVMRMAGGGGGGGNANGVDGEIQRTLAGYLDNYGDRFAQGTSRVGGDEFATIRGGGSHEYQVRLQAGTHYVILGACDTNCRDVDLFLSDSSGTQIAYDMLLDDYPVLSLTPATTGDYTVRIGMANCRQDPCYGAARVTRVG